MALNLVPDPDNPKTNGIHVPPKEYPDLDSWPTTNAAGYSINEIPSGHSRNIRIICIGAGASGINLAKFTQDQLENVELVMYEKNRDVAGTWFENSYP